MQRIDLPWIIEVMEAIDELSGITAGKLKSDCWWPLFNAQRQLDLLFTSSVYTQHLKISRQKANGLRATISDHIADPEDDSSSVETMAESDAWIVRHMRDQFKTVFLSELSGLPLFLVTEKESYDVNTLIDDGERLFPPSLRMKAPDAIADAREVGKALAFELGTACGFHTFRVTEVVLKRYYDSVAGGRPRPNLETIGSFAREMVEHKLGDDKIAHSLKQLAKLHRNPLIHPEVILDVSEAIETLGIARSVIGAMLKSLPDVPATTTNAAAG